MATFLSINSFAGMLYDNPSFGINKAEANILAERSAESVAMLFLYKCGLGLSS